MKNASEIWGMLLLNLLSFSVKVKSARFLAPTVSENHTF